MPGGVTEQEKATKVRDELSAMHAQELLALADTIKLLNDGETLVHFKKTLLRGVSSSLHTQIFGCQVGFGKICKVIDILVANLYQGLLADTEMKGD